MAKRNSVIEEIQELIQKIKREYREEVDFRFSSGENALKKHGVAFFVIISPRLKKILREKFNFPLGVANHLDYAEIDQEGGDLLYRIHNDNDVLSSADGRVWPEKEKGENCQVCGNLTFKKNGRMELWDGEKTDDRPDPKVIAYFHPECAKKYFAGKEHQLIEKYYNSLVEQFIKDPLHKKEISIVFQNHLGGSENTRILGRTSREGGSSKSKIKTTWETINGVKVPGSERATTTTEYFPYKYTISFLNDYQDENQLRGAVVHEFTHHFLFSTIGNHTHDDNFYSIMERLESWLDQNQGLDPRNDKSHDRDQYENDSSSSTNENQPQQKSNKTPDVLLKEAEFNQLKRELEKASDLTTLENTYQKIKSSSPHVGGDSSDIQQKLDDFYQFKKQLFQAQDKQHSVHDSNGDGLRKGDIFLIIMAAVIGGIIFLAMISHLASGKRKNPTSVRRKKNR